MSINIRNMDVVAKREYKEPCTPQMLEDIAADKACEFKPRQWSHYNEVYPGVLVGGESIALDKYVLQDMGVTDVVNCTQGKDPGEVNTDARYYKGTKIKLYAIRARDEEGNRIVPFFTITTSYISRALEAGGKVLVHCQTGISLSPTIVIAFLMQMNHFDVRDAIRQVRYHRAICPNQSFREQLCELNKQLFPMNSETT
ncbi:dual specificity protein phosphatase 3-like [Amphiura filiformis]|uniref:dual specificity protein phosphatase 3-like n=1 Tax=Amphiura filiformis TaxID=82378 RepID=UPI003B213D94